MRYRERLKLDFICLTSPFNRPRIAGLLRLDAYFPGSRVICLGYPDDPAVVREGAPFDFDDSWMEGIDFPGYPLIFSHNRHGEYGHPHHIYLHQALKSRGIPFISFGHHGDYHFALQLSPQQIQEKQDIIRKLYGIETRRLLPSHSYWDCGYEDFRLEGFSTPPKALWGLEGLIWQNRLQEKNQ